MFNKEPAWWYSLIAGLITAVSAAYVSSIVNGQVNWSLLLVGAIPPVFGVLTRNGVVPVEKVTELIDMIDKGSVKVDSTQDALTHLTALVRGEIVAPSVRKIPPNG